MSKIKEKFISLYNENKWYWFFILTLLVGGSIYRLKLNHDIANYGVYGVAEIISYNKMGSRGLTDIKYEYFANGQKYTKGYSGQYLSCEEDNSCIGRWYEIKYLPQNPNKCFIYFDRPIE